MNITIVLPLAVAIVGVLLFALVDGKLGEIGKIAWAMGLLVFLLSVAGRTLHLG